MSKSMWIGGELGDKDGTKVLIGINQDGEHTVEYGNAIDNQWHYGDAIVVKSGEDIRVFDDNDQLIKTKEV